MSELSDRIREDLASTRMVDIPFLGMAFARGQTMGQVLQPAALDRLTQIATRGARFMRNAFMEYGQHKPGCPGGDGNRCPCGFFQMVRRVS